MKGPLLLAQISTFPVPATITMQAWGSMYAWCIICALNECSNIRSDSLNPWSTSPLDQWFSASTLLTLEIG